MLRSKHLTSLVAMSLLLSCHAKKNEKPSASSKPDEKNYQETESSSDSQADLSLDQFLEQLYQGYEVPAELTTVGAIRSGKLWQYISQEKQQDLNQYFVEHKLGYEAFTKAPVAYNGTPAVIFQLLKDVMPELASDREFEKATGYFKQNSQDLLPWGFAFTQPPQQAGAQPSPLLVNLTCAACHTGRVQVSAQEYRPLVGAPSTVADINAFRTLLSKAVSHPNYTVEKFTAALLAKKDGELYGPDRIQQEKIDKAIFLGTAQSPALGAALLQQFKEGMQKRGEYASKTVLAYSYKNDPRLMANAAGHIDFPVAVALAAVPASEVLADPAANIKKFFPAQPGIGDIMSVWQQEKRNFAQWDGNLKTKLIRNLGAEVGIAADPKAVNYPNALLTTSFVDKLPAPPYPFAIDLEKAAAGKKIYDSACASCHESEQFMPVAQIGTEAGRAIGLTKDTRNYLIQALKAACHDKANPDCQVADDDVVVPRSDNPGYLALPLTGIWARAPYLHNGSVPTLYHLLVADERPVQFVLNDFAYDQQKLGFNWRMPIVEDNPMQSDNPSQSKGSTPVASKHLVSMDSRIPGNGNFGHSDRELFNGGIDFKREPQKLEALLEYLKTL